MKKLILIISALLLFSCSPQKKLQKLLNKYPELVAADTVHFNDTVYTTAIKADSVFVLDTINRTDTFTLEKEKLKVKVILQKDSIYISGECQTDTIYRTRDVVVDKLLPCPPEKEKSFWQKLKGAAIWVLVGAVAMVVLFAVPRR